MAPHFESDCTEYCVCDSEKQNSDTMIIPTFNQCTDLIHLIPQNEHKTAYIIQSAENDAADNMAKYSSS